MRYVAAALLILSMSCGVDYDLPPTAYVPSSGDERIVRLVFDTWNEVFPEHQVSWEQCRFDEDFRILKASEQQFRSSDHCAKCGPGLCPQRRTSPECPRGCGKACALYVDDDPVMGGAYMHGDESPMVVIHERAWDERQRLLVDETVHLLGHGYCSGYENEVYDFHDSERVREVKRRVRAQLN